MDNQLFFKREDLSAWTGGNQDLIRGFEQLISTVQSALDKINTAQQTADTAVSLANGAYPEYITNANGNAVKLSDGTIVQWGSGVYSFVASVYSALITVIHPIVMIDSAYSFHRDPTSFTVAVGVSAKTDSSAGVTKAVASTTFKFVCDSAQTGTGTFDWFIVGRWK